MHINRRTLYWLGLLGGIVLALGLAIAYFTSRPVEVTVVQFSTDVPVQVFGLGTVEAQTISKIGFETAGTLIELKVDHGDPVKTGDLLGRLQSREQEARVTQARAAVTQAKAAIEQAQSAVEKAAVVLKQKIDINARRQQLVQSGAVSREAAADTQAGADIANADLSQAHSAVSVARANLEQAEAALAFEVSRLAKYTLYAPFDGMIMARHKDLGSALNANESVFTLVDPATIWALVYVDETRAGQIEVGQPAVVTRRSAPNSRMEANVVRIDIESDRVNEERRVYLRCTGCPLTFHVGEQAEAVITVATLPRARLVKLTSLASIRGREATAWIVENGYLRTQDVTIGSRTLDGRIEIVGGVPDGAEVADEPAQTMKAGSKARIISPSEKTK
jgi:HlyD family secretion protein